MFPASWFPVYSAGIWGEEDAVSFLSKLPFWTAPTLSCHLVVPETSLFECQIVFVDDEDDDYSHGIESQLSWSGIYSVWREEFYKLCTRSTKIGCLFVKTTAHPTLLCHWNNLHQRTPCAVVGNQSFAENESHTCRKNPDKATLSDRKVWR